MLQIPNDTILALLYDTLVYYSELMDSLMELDEDYAVFNTSDSFPIFPILYVFDAHYNFSSLRSKIEAEVLTLERQGRLSFRNNPEQHYIVSECMRSILNTNSVVSVGSDLYLFGEQQQVLIPNNDYQDLSTVLSLWYNFGEFEGTFRAYKSGIARPLVGDKRIEDIEGEDAPCDQMLWLVQLVTDGCPRTFQFEIVSHLGNISSIYWNFGDNTSSSERYTVHYYETSGEYEITANVQLRNGINMECSKTIKVQDCIAFITTPVLTMTEEGVLCKVGTYPHHCDEDAQIISYSWSFGNGRVSSEANPTVLFENDGNFTIELMVEFSDGCVASDKQTVSISGTGNCCKNITRGVTLIIDVDNNYKLVHSFATYNMIFHRIIVKTIHYKKKTNGSWKRERAHTIFNSFGGEITSSGSQVCDSFSEVQPNGHIVHGMKANNYDFGVGHRFRIRHDDIFSSYGIRSDDSSIYETNDGVLYLHNLDCR